MVFFHSLWLPIRLSTFDGLLYALATGAILGWLWPR
jgi:hypothetical protein